jgi:hypothetical protein
MRVLWLIPMMQSLNTPKMFSYMESTRKENKRIWSFFPYMENTVIDPNVSLSRQFFDQNNLHLWSSFSTGPNEQKKTSHATLLLKTFCRNR